MIAGTDAHWTAAGGPLLTALTTEHFTLQTARSATISDSASRSSLFLSTVSSVVVALAFIGQVSELGRTFFAFALVLLPTLFTLGVLTYLRLNESAQEDAFYARAINRIRGFYTSLDDEARAYLLLSDRDDLAGAMASVGRSPSRSHRFTHTAVMVLVVTALLGGVSLALAAAAAGISLAASTFAGAAAALALAALGFLHHARSFEQADRRTPVRTPTLPKA